MAACVAVWACSDKHSPTSPNVTHDSQGKIVMGTCTTIPHLDSLANVVFGAGTANANTVHTKLDLLRKEVDAYDVSAAQATANEIVNFVKTKATQGGIVGSETATNEFIGSGLCYAGLSPDTFLILPSAEPQVHTTNDGASGLRIEPGAVTQPTLITITVADSGTPSPLQTKLDQYPVYVNISTTSALTKPATVALCPSVQVPAAVRSRLRVGHQAKNGFEITPQADASFLTCESSLAKARGPAWLRSLAKLVLPRPLYAAPFEVVGIGGSATEFSPFGVVDPEVSFSGGVGGSATEFGPGAKKGNLVIGGQCTEVSATVGTPLEPECRPQVTVTTPNGTILQNVPVAWVRQTGDGSIAASNLLAQSCAAFGTTAATFTDNLGRAAICWTMGLQSGGATVQATPGTGGDLPPGVTISPASITFSATATPIFSGANATGGTFVFDNAAHPGSGACSNGLAPALSYSNGAPPLAAGTYTLTVTCGGGGTFTQTTASAPIVILPATPVVKVTCPSSPLVFAGSALTPCSATVTGPALNTSASPTYVNNIDAGTATASAAVTAAGNYGAASASATFSITPAPSQTVVTCPASPVTFAAAPLTPCTAKTTSVGNLNVSTAVTYTSNVNVGTANASAKFAAVGNYLGSEGSASFQISKLGIVATAGSATMTQGSAVPVIPCVVSGLPSSDAGAVSCTSGVPSVSGAGTYATTPVITPANPANYLVTPVSGTLTVTAVSTQHYHQEDCFDSPLYSSMPDTKSAQQKGSNVPIKCELDLNDQPVSTAHGDLVVVDRGTTGTAAPVTVLSLSNAFTYVGGGKYQYSLSTGGSGFVAGHYYYVTATWDDGSTTTGWFLLK
ncbi:MAG TPA: MBG domain-containing protein [Gemmatimonadaceae bacterium]|nr:MBG domain-containing protein [Gemmatimonadaceae bacterium]